MKRILSLLLLLGIFALLFFFIAPKQNSSLAATCSSYGATCAASGVCNAEGTRVTATGCTAPQVCCQFNACETCASKNYACGSFTNNCGQLKTCGNNGACTNSLATCNRTTHVCTAPTCTSIPGASCTTSNICNAEGTRVTATGCSGTASVCCQFNTCETCASKGYQCGSFTNNCGQLKTCGNNGACTNSLATCNRTTHVCTAPTCSSVTNHACTSSNICNAEGRAVSGYSGCSGTTPVCCSFNSTPPPPPPPGGGNNCEADYLGTCMPICSSPISGATGCTSPNVCCGSGSSNTQCPVCTSPYYYDAYTGKCGFYRDSLGYTVYENPTYQTCNLSQGQTCSPGSGCGITSLGGFQAGALPCGPDGTSCTTAFGTINTDAASLVKAFFAIVLSISGGIAVLLIIISGYGLIASQGNPEKIKEAQERLTAAIIGLLFVIFAFSILKFIGVDVLNIFRQ